MRTSTKCILFMFAVIGSALCQGGNTVTVRFAGAPTGSCSPVTYAVNNSNGDFYDCVSGAWIKVGSAGAGSPAGSNTQVQFNDSGSFGGDAAFTFVKATGVLTVGTLTTTGTVGTWTATEGTAPSGVASSDVMYADSTAHRFVMKNNNGSAVNVVSSGTDINTSDQVTATHLASALPVNQGGTGTASTLTGLVRGSSSAMTAAELSGAVTTSGSNATTLAAKYATLTCDTGLGDGLNAMTAGTYLQSTCRNETGATLTITAIRCFTDNNGSSTLNVTDNSANGLLTGAVTCTNSYANGTQSGTTTLASGGYFKFTFVADGTSKQTDWVIVTTR